jgi:uncharacterized protein YecT (DUF1311 family)
MKELTPAHQDALRATQRAWIAHRDFEYGLIDAVHAQTEGTLCQIFHADRRTELTRQRALDLQGYLNWLRDFGKEPAG